VTFCVASVVVDICWTVSAAAVWLVSGMEVRLSKYDEVAEALIGDV